MSSGKLLRLTNCSDVSLRVFAYRTFGIPWVPCEGGDVLPAVDSNKVGSEVIDKPRVPSSSVGKSMVETLCTSCYVPDIS